MGWRPWLPLPGSDRRGCRDGRGLLPLVLDLQLPERAAQETLGHGVDAPAERGDRPGLVGFVGRLLQLHPRVEDYKASGRSVRRQGHVQGSGGPRGREGRLVGEPAKQLRLVALFVFVDV